MEKPICFKLMVSATLKMGTIAPSCQIHTIKSFHKDFGLKRKFDSDGNIHCHPFYRSLKDVSREMLMERIMKIRIAIIRDKLSFSVDHTAPKMTTKDNIQDQVDLLNKPELSTIKLSAD